MSIANFPLSLQPIIQQGFLEREFEQGLRSILGFRVIADREEFPIRIGETLTKTRPGLKAPVETPMNPSTNTNLDNGLTPSAYSVEQYTMTMNQYGDTIDLNIITDKVGLASQFLQNALTNGIQAAQSLDRLARNALFNAYLSGNTRVIVNHDKPQPFIKVDDIRGFQQVLVNGVMQPVNANNHAVMPIFIGDKRYTLMSAAPDATNVSTTPGGISGTLMMEEIIDPKEVSINTPVVSVYAPTLLRPNAKATITALTASDLLTMSLVLDAVAILRDNAVPTQSGLYHCYLDNKAARQLFADPDFKELYRGQNASQEFRQGRVIELLDVRFIPTTEAIQQTLGNVKIHRPIICGAGALIEGTFAGMTDAAQNTLKGGGLIEVIDSVAQITREPLDRLKQIIAQSWYWIGGYAVPTDQTANTNIIPTINNSYYKRAIVLEVGGV